MARKEEEMQMEGGCHDKGHFYSELRVAGMPTKLVMFSYTVRSVLLDGFESKT